MSGYLARLQFIDKIGFDRAYVEFRHNASLSSEEETEFIRSLLDSGNQYERTSILNAFSFISAFIDIGKYPRQSVLTRALYLAMVDNTFVSKFACIGSRIHTKGWIFHALARIMDKQMQTFIKSIKNDAPIWEYLIQEIEENAKAIQFDPKMRYADRPSPTLIEVFPLFWTSDLLKMIPLESLIADFCKFCFETNSKTSLKLVSILAYVFPIDVYRCSHEKMYLFSHDAIKQMLACCKDPEIADPEDASGLRKLAISLVPFDQQRCHEVVHSIPGCEDVEAMCDHYDGSKHEFVF